MTLTLLWLEESIFFSDRTAGTEDLSSQMPLEASSCEEKKNSHKNKIRNSAVRHAAFSSPHLLQLAGFPSLPQTINILLFFVLSMTHSRHDIFLQWLRNSVLLCIKFQSNADEHFSGTDLWIPFPRNGDALTKFAE